MPLYTVTDDYGRSFDLEGDSPPTEDELEEIFSKVQSKPSSDFRTAQATLPEGLSLTPNLDSAVDFASMPESAQAPDEFGIGEEVRGFGRAGLRGIGSFLQQGNIESMRTGREYGLPPEMSLQEGQSDYELKLKEIDDLNAQIKGKSFREARPLIERKNQLLSESAGQFRQIQASKAEQEGAREYAINQRAMEALPRTQAAEEFFKPETPWWHFFKNPVELSATTMAESAPALVQTMAAAPGGPGAVAAAAGGSSFGAESAARISRAMQEGGVDTKDPNAVMAWFSDRAKADPAIAKAELAALGPAGFDALTGGLAGQLVKRAIGKGIVKVGAATAGEIGMQMAGGGLGSIAGSKLAGEDVDWKDVILEVASEFAPTEAISNVTAERAANRALQRSDVRDVELEVVHEGGERRASEIRKAAALHGDVRTQQRQGQQAGVPQPQGRERVQSQTEGGLQEGLKMPMEIEKLTPEEQAAEAEYQRMEREGMEIGTPLNEGERGELKTLSDRFFEGRDMSSEELNTLDLLEARNRAEMQGRVELGEGMIGETERMLTEAVHAEGISDNVELVQPSKITPDNPLSGRVAQWNPTTGKIEINGRALVQDIQAIPQSRRAQYVRRMVNEESIHSRTTEKQARDFHDNASWIERRLGERIYSGKWGKNLSPEALGYEMVRRRMQHLSRMGATEVAFALGRERWTLKSLDMVDQMIASTREALGTRASKVQTRILGQIERNNNIARKALLAAAVGAPRREVENLVERLKARTERVSTDEAVDAGLQARSIEDLDALANGWREWKQDLDAVKARAKTDPSAMMQYAAVAQRGQLYREAIEAATNSGSHKVEARVGREKGLPPPPLDHTKNPEVADWLEKNGPELGIKIDQTVGAPRRTTPEDEKLVRDATDTVLAADKYKDIGKFVHEFDRAFSMARKITNYEDALRAYEALADRGHQRMESEIEKKYGPQEYDMADVEQEGVAPESWRTEREDMAEDSQRERDQYETGEGLDYEVRQDISYYRETPMGKLDDMLFELTDWISSRKPRPDRGESYQGELGIGAPRRSNIKLNPKQAEKHGKLMDALKKLNEVNNRLVNDIRYKHARSRAEREGGAVIPPEPTSRSLWQTWSEFFKSWQYLDFEHRKLLGEEMDKAMDEFATQWMGSDEKVMQYTHDILQPFVGEGTQPESSEMSFPASPRRGMSKKEAERIEALRKYQEAMGQRPATPQGPASGSVSKREAPQSSRKSASEFFAKPTPESIEKIANDVISDPTQVPTFDRFLRHVQAAHGDIKSGQVTELWQQILGKALDTMPAEEMERLVDKMGLRRQVFGSIKQGSKALGLTGAPPPIARQGKIAEAAPADIAQTSKAKAQARAAKLLERADILEAKASKARTQQETTALNQRAQILRRTADNISAAIQTGEGMPMTQGDLLPGITARTSQLTGQPVPVPGKPGATKFVGKTPNIPEIQPKGGQVKARDRAKRILFEELTKEAPSLTFGLNRKEITPEDIRWGEEGNEIYAVSKEDLADLDTLGYELTRKAATDATTRKIAGGGTMVVEEAALPRSATKRVVALFDPKTKKVHLVSGYRDGRRGPVFRDPESVTGEHRTLEQLKRYRPLFSLPLDTPVQNFHEVFSSVKAFSDKFYKKIRLDAQRVGWRGLGEEPTIEGTEGLEGEGGMFQGPEAGVQRATEGMTYGILDHMGAEVTGAEARQLFKVFRTFESREDVETYMAQLRTKVVGTRENRLLNAQIEDLNQHIERLRDERAGQIGSKEQKLTEKLERLRERKAKLEARRKPQLTNQDWLFLTGLAKAEAGLNDIYRPKKEGVAGERLVKRPTPEEISEETINELHRLSILNATSTSFAKAAQKQLAPRPAPTTPLRSEEAVSPTAREISMRSRVPPTVVRPEHLPPGYQTVPRVAPPPADVVGGGLRPPEATAPIEQPPIAGSTEALTFVGRPTKTALRKGRVLDYTQQHRPAERVPSQGGKVAEPSSYPSSGRAEPENVRYAVRPERKAEIAQEVNQIADREIAKEPPQPPQPQQPDLPGTVGAPRRTPGRTLGDKTNNILNDFGSIYDKWMVDRIYEYGGRVSKQFATMAKGMIDRQKELYGGLTPLLDRARRLAGGIESFDPTIAGSGVKGWVKDLPRRGVESAKAMRAAKWLNGLNKITPKTAVTRAVGALEGTINVPPWAQKVVQLAQDANLEIGRLLQPVIQGFVATGLWQRNFTGLGYDIIRTGAGDMWKAWTMGMAVANRTQGVSLLTTLRDVRQRFNKMKEVLDDPLSTAEQIEQVNQDMARAYPNVVTHVKHNKMWQEVVHGNLFSYLEQTAQRATHVRSFREQFPNTPDGQRALKTMYRDMKQEMTPEIQRDLDGLLRALNGHPTDEYTGKYSDYIGMGPQQPLGQGLRFMNQTVNRVLAQQVLSGQMLTQTPELFSGATPQKLGYKNYLRAIARAKSLYETMELFGSVNRVIHDYTFNPNAALRSGSRMLANLTSKAFFTNALNELQEALAATSARITVEDILSGNLSDWQKRMLPETFKDMGFTEREAADMMRGDQTLLNQFQRKAAAALTGGNKSIAESSRMGANRMFNSIFRFQSYPMMKMRQTRDIVTDLHDAWFNHGTPEAKKRSLEKAAYFFGGNIMQGAMLSALTSLMFGGVAGLKIKGHEAKDEPIKFLMESFLASLSGPLYMLWRGRRYGGGPRAMAKGFGEQALRAAFPYAVVNDVNDMIDGVGPYRNKSPGARAMQFVSQKTPGAKLISQGLAMFGLKEKNPEVDQAISAFYRWRRDEMGWKEVNEFGPDDRAEFRMHVGNAVEAAKRGDTDTYINEWLLAVDAKDQQSFRDSIRKKKVLVDKNGAPLSEEWKDKLINRIGLEAFEQLEGFDMMMDVAAEGAIPQP